MSRNKRLPSMAWLRRTWKEVVARPGCSTALEVPPPAACWSASANHGHTSVKRLRAKLFYCTDLLSLHLPNHPPTASPKHQLISLKACLSLSATSNQLMTRNLCPQALSLQGKSQKCLVCINYIYSNTHQGPRLKKYLKYLFGFTAFRS